MDPVSVIGLTGAIIGIVDVVTRSVKLLSDLKSRYNIIDLKINLLIGQLSTLRAALNQIDDLASSYLATTRHEQLYSDVSVSLQGCEAIIFVLNDRLTQMERNDYNRLTKGSKAYFLWDESTISEYLVLINNQINALNLLLTALQW
ncbi:hypothetical protein F4677DRAFT_443316 [Hypoxylon crocopeplum]|nr:hypothetical protein F4677DRAFT_443316 [Hypoxylon crocopeplum]